jgi:hypothetical protein
MNERPEADALHDAVDADSCAGDAHMESVSETHGPGAVGADPGVWTELSFMRNPERPILPAPGRVEKRGPT